MINLKTGDAISGVVTDVTVARKSKRTTLHVQGALIHSPGADPQPADGTILVDSDNVSFIQTGYAGVH